MGTENSSGAQSVDWTMALWFLYQVFVRILDVFLLARRESGDLLSKSLQEKKDPVRTGPFFSRGFKARPPDAPRSGSVFRS